MHRSLKKQSKKKQTPKTLTLPDAEVYHEDLTDYQPLQAQASTMQVEDNVFQTCISDDESQSNFESNLNNISKKIKKNEGTEQLLPQQNRPIELDLPLLPSEEDYQSLNVLDQPNVVLDPSEKILPREFFTVHPVTLSKNLVGKVLVRRVGNQVIKARIVETEAYNVNDMACHAHHGKRTERTKPLFMQGGHLYVFLIYGVSYCLNITATVEGEPSACLIRAVEIIEGHDHVIANRNVKNPSKTGKELTNGPGKLSAALKVDKSLNFYDITKPGEFYVVEGDGSPFEMVVSKRINIEYAGEDKHKPWRFYIKDNKFVSVKGVVLDVVDPVQFCKQAYDEDEDEVIEEKTTVSVTSTTTTTTTMNSISMFDLDKFRFTK